MALPAVFLQDRAHVLGIGRLPAACVLWRNVIGQPSTSVSGVGNLLAGKHRFECVFQIVARRLLANAAETVLVVDPAAIAERVSRHRERPPPACGAHPETRAQAPPKSLTKGNSISCCTACVAIAMIESSSAALTATNCTSLPRYSFSSACSVGRVALHQRATRVGEHQHKRLLLAEVIERARQRADVGELQLADCGRRLLQRLRQCAAGAASSNKMIAKITWRRCMEDHSY